MRRQEGDQTGQESRSFGRAAATSVTAMDLTIHTTVLPHDDPEESLAFYRDALGFEVRTDYGNGKMRWITVGPPGQPDISILLAPPGADPGITDDERRTISEMMAKGTYGLDPARDQGSGRHLRSGCRPVTPRSCRSRPSSRTAMRDCAFRDPAGNMVRIQELR